jgi:hypothetical protein
MWSGWLATRARRPAEENGIEQIPGSVVNLMMLAKYGGRA